MERTFIHRSVSEKAHGHLIAALVLSCQRDSGSDWQLSSNNAIASQHTVFIAPHMHRATLTLAASRYLPKEFSHHFIGRHALEQSVSMLTIAGQHLILRAQRG